MERSILLEGGSHHLQIARITAPKGGSWPTQYPVPTMVAGKLIVELYEKKTIRVFRYARTLSDDEASQFARLIFSERDGKVVGVRDATASTDVADVKSLQDATGGTTLSYHVEQQTMVGGRPLQPTLWDKK